MSIIVTDNRSCTWVRVTPAAAIQAYLEHKLVTICPVKMLPFKLWKRDLPESKNTFNNTSLTISIDIENKTFESITRIFMSNNCNVITGTYLSFYVKEIINKENNNETFSH